TLWHPAWIDTNVYHSESDPHFIQAFSVVAVGSIVLSIFEYNITHSHSPLLRDFRILKAELKREILHSKQFIRLLTKGSKEWIHWLELHMFPAEDISKVHSTAVVARQ